ncbi:alpha-1A adrenergic receptor-like [Colossoma macropomum]|uniref:alpha-1A adrenergic receptor-like n=1 Tax=Colossoma macropomum TaxID=42526 RepID=UPI0018646A26|nr:alpha-1A adrenergic receptor-like [Colossoma macropomum]
MNAKEWTKSIIRGFMCLSGIIGNHWLGFRSLPKSRSQLRTNDILFVNLALSNLITNYLVDLPDTLDFVKRWPMGKMYCGAFNFCSNLSETSSIFTTLFITVFWHQKLVGSLKRGGAPAQMDNVRLVAALLVGSWIAAVVFSLPQFFFVSAAMWNESLVDCVEYFPSQEARQIYETLYLTLANVVPIVGIVVASIQIAVTLLQNQKRIKNTTRAGTRGGNPPVAEDHRRAAGGNAMTSATNTTPPEFSSKVTQDRSISSSGNQVRAAKSVVAVATVFLICWLIHLLLSITSTIYQSTVVDEMTSYIGAVYTCIIPYIYLHGVKKFNCSSRD